MNHLWRVSVKNVCSTHVQHWHFHLPAEFGEASKLIQIWFTEVHVPKESSNQDDEIVGVRRLQEIDELKGEP